MDKYKERLERRLDEIREKHIVMTREYGTFLDMSIEEGALHPNDAHRIVNYFESLVQVVNTLEIYNASFPNPETLQAEKDLTSLLEGVKKEITGLVVNGLYR